MQKIKLAAFDLDDTLLDKNNEIPKSTVNILHQAHKCGVMITLVSGRAYPSANRIGLELGYDVPIICYNGAMIRSADGVSIFSDYLQEETGREIIDFCHLNGLYLQMYDEQHNIVVEKINDKTLADPDYYNTGCREVGSFNNLKEIKTPKMMIFDTPDKISFLQKELEPVFKDRLFFTQSKNHLLEMMPPGINKAVSLARFANSLSYSAEEVMACGDNANDIEMVKWAGIGVAVANATDALKAAADYICVNERSEGAEEAIKRFVLH